MRLRAPIKTAAVVAVLAATLPASAVAKPHSHHHHHHPKPHPQARPLYWGAWIGPQLTGEEPPWDMAAARRFEHVVGKNLSILQFSAPFAKCDVDCSFYTFPTDEMTKIRRYGAIPLFSWNSGSIGNTQDFQLSDLLSGRYDTYIRAFAKQAKAWGHPFFLRFDWEMNGNWFPWGATSEGSQGEGFKVAWRHVWRIFHRVGADNVTWVWCPYARDEPLAPFYPGSRYVDWTCLDGYNWGPESEEPTPWRTFSQIFTAAYHRIVTEVAPNKPMMIGEVASDDSGGDKAAWIREMFADLRLGFPKIAALVWFDKYDLGVQWPIEISPIARAVFAQGLRRGNYRENVFSRLRRTPIPAPRP